MLLKLAFDSQLPIRMKLAFDSQLVIRLKLASDSQPLIQLKLTSDSQPLVCLKLASDLAVKGKVKRNLIYSTECPIFCFCIFSCCESILDILGKALTLSETVSNLRNLYSICENEKREISLFSRLGHIGPRSLKKPLYVLRVVKSRLNDPREAKYSLKYSL